MSDTRFWFFLIGMILFSPGNVFSATPQSDEVLHLTRVTPKGEDVEPGRQIVFQFSRPVVPVGRMDRKASEIPIQIEPRVACEWRWLNTSALACQLTEKNGLQPATRYRIKVNPGIRAEDGAVLAQANEHEFITRRPRVSYTRFSNWRSPGHPQIRVMFNQPVFASSVADQLSLAMKGGQTAHLNVEPDENDRNAPLVQPFPGAGSAFYGAHAPENVYNRLTIAKGQEARRVWVVSPKEELPLDTPVELKIAPGLVSAKGIERGVESRTVVSFHTFPEFSFLGIRCSTGEKGNPVLIPPSSLKELSKPEEFTEKCLPLNRVALVFSAPVIIDEVEDHVTISPDLAGDRKDYDPWKNSYRYSSLRQPHRKDRDYRVWLPERLKAFQVYRVLGDLKLLKDEFGRTLTGAMDMAFMTSHRQPNLTLVHEKAVLEKNLDTEVPLFVTNLEKVEVTYQSLTSEGKQTNQKLPLPISPVEDVAFMEKLNVREMLKGKSGAVRGTMGTVPLDPNKPLDNWAFFAQVTPFHVHVKLGHFNSLVWVTDMATGLPVEGATVSIYKDNYDTLSVSNEKTEKAETNSSGIATLPGTDVLTPDLKLLQGLYRDKTPRLFVRIDKEEDLALVPLDNHFRIWGRGVWSSNQKLDGHMHAWGTTAQGVYKAGDTVQFKLYARNQSNRHWVASKREGYLLEVVDPKGKTIHKVEDLSLSQFGSYDGEFKVARQGAVGWYQFKLKPQFSKKTLWPMRVLISDFTPSPFKVRSDLNGDIFQPGDQVEVTTQALLHSGGPYVDARTRLTANLSSSYFSSKDPAAKGFQFDSQGTHSYRRSFTVHQNEGKVDGQGQLSDEFVLKDQGIVYGKLSVESAVRDDRGKYIATAVTAKFVGRDRFVGMKNTRWLHKEDEPAEFEYLVVDETGKLVSDVAVSIKIERQETKASRVKGAGNAYLTKYIQEWVTVAECEEKSSLEASICRFTPEDPGSFRMTATIMDTKNRSHSTKIHTWVAGRGQVVWQQPNDSTLSIVPEKTDYKIGEQARYLVKNPFPGAKALITVERYGVLKQWVETLDGSTPVIEFPVEPDFLPGFFLSVLVVSPRVDKPLGDGQVDLGKPTHRIGYVKVPVKDPYKEIAVSIETDKAVYKPRETVHATLRATPRQGAKNSPLELAVVVIDEAVFDLNTSGRKYYDPYTGFNRLDNLDVNNYSLLTALIGRQKFEKKGANAGGGGVAGGPSLSLRSLFKYVSYWNPSIEVASGGEAQIEFELPDNLTGWRIFALAVTPEDRMGLGDANFKTNRPTELRPVMPNQVVEGDRFLAGFSVMNRTNAPRDITVSIKASGALDGDQDIEQTVSLDPFKRQSIWLPIQTKGSGEISLVAVAKDAIDQDAVTHRVPVNKRRSLETGATYGTTTEASVSDTVLFPEGIHADVGGISVVVSPSVIGNVEGAFKYIRDYPYLCWEQRLTKGVMASHYSNLKSYLPDSLKWKGSQTLPQETLDDASSFQAPNGGMAYWVPQDRYVSPYLSAYTALAFNWLKASGHTVPQEVEKKLHGYLERFLRRDVMPDFFTQGMASTVRAVALAALSGHGKVTLADLERYRTHVPEMSLFGKTHYLQAAQNVGGADVVIAEVLNDVLSHASQSGGKFQFNEPWDDGYRYLLATPLRTNCSILSGLVAMEQLPFYKDKVGDIPFKMVRAITQTRGNRDHWENTQENLFCLNALVDYSRVYEQVKPDMLVRAFAGNQQFGETRFDDLRNPAVALNDTTTQPRAGLKTKVKVEKEGQGRIYYSTRLSYALKEDNAKRINSGLEIRREFSVEREGNWELLQSPMQIKRGELVRVDIYLSLPTARHFVVVDDPIPGGLEPVNRDLATASGVDADKGGFKAAGGSWWFEREDWQSYGISRWSFYHKELRHDSARFYSDYLGAGNYHLSYTAQAIAEGKFSAMPIHTEEMYDPDVYGKGLPGTLNVKPQDD